MHMMIIKTPQNIHEICFSVIRLTFTCDLKTDFIMSEPHHVTEFSVNLFHTLDIIDYLGNFCLDIFDNLSPSQDYFCIEISKI